MKTHFPPQGAYRWSALESMYTALCADAGISGNVFYVNSATGTDDTAHGFSPEAPFASIAYAVGTACTADNNDLVLVMPGHTEVITGAAGVNMSVAGVTLRGLGIGRQRGTITYSTSTAASFDVTAARCCIDNLTFVGTGIDALTAMVNVKAADCSFRNCEFEHANASGQATLVLLTNASANRLTIDQCYFHGSTDAGTTAAISLVGGDSIRITRCDIFGSYATSGGAIAGATTDSTNLYIGYCDIINRTASSTKVIVLTSSSTGCIGDNLFGILSGTAPVTAAALDVIGANYYKAAVGVAAGTLV